MVNTYILVRVSTRAVNIHGMIGAPEVSVVCSVVSTLTTHHVAEGGLILVGSAVISIMVRGKAALSIEQQQQQHAQGWLRIPQTRPHLCSFPRRGGGSQHATFRLSAAPALPVSYNRFLTRPTLIHDNNDPNNWYIIMYRPWHYFFLVLSDIFTRLVVLQLGNTPLNVRKPPQTIKPEN